MKKTLLQICSVIVLVVLAAAVSAQAQYRANITFDFRIDRKIYKAGEYSVGPVSRISDTKNIVIRDANGRNSYMMLPTISAVARPETAILVFNRYGDSYFLAEINAPDFSVKLSKSKAEEKLAGGEKPQKETIELARKN
ncbi:MAG TPA: hypothetical protein VF721_17535 [Pyrinomonadaceae bacterium]|jgi:hypothetical protein